MANSILAQSNHGSGYQVETGVGPFIFPLLSNHGPMIVLSLSAFLSYCQFCQQQNLSPIITFPPPHPIPIIILLSDIFSSDLFQKISFRILLRNSFQIFLRKFISGCFDTSGSMIPLLVLEILPSGFFCDRGGGILVVGYIDFKHLVLML